MTVNEKFSVRTTISMRTRARGESSGSTCCLSLLRTQAGRQKSDGNKVKLSSDSLKNVKKQDFLWSSAIVERNILKYCTSGTCTLSLHFGSKYYSFTLLHLFNYWSKCCIGAPRRFFSNVFLLIY